MTSKFILEDPHYVENFLQELKKQQAPFAESAEAAQIAKTHLADLMVEGVYFDADTWTSISTNAARQLARKHQSGPLHTTWSMIGDDFKKKYWGYLPSDKPQTEVRVNIGRELFAYIWAMVQALMIMKVVIFYLGLKSAADAGPWDKFWVFAAISFSFGSLFFFAWRKTRK